MVVRIAYREDPDQAAFCTVCLVLFCRQPVFEILEHLLKNKVSFVKLYLFL